MSELTEFPDVTDRLSCFGPAVSVLPPSSAALPGLQ